MQFTVYSLIVYISEKTSLNDVKGFCMATVPSDPSTHLSKIRAHSPDPNIASAVGAVVVHAAQQGFIHGPHVVLAKHAVRAASRTHSYGYAHPARARNRRTHGHAMQDGTQRWRETSREFQVLQEGAGVDRVGSRQDWFFKHRGDKRCYSLRHGCGGIPPGFCETLLFRCHSTNGLEPM